jgi:hypothetical protein
MKEVYVHSYGEESYGWVYENSDGTYDVFSNTYGGLEMYEDTFDSLDTAIEYSKSFT